MKQTAMVACLVVGVFAAGFVFGRWSVPAPVPVAEVATAMPTPMPTMNPAPTAIVGEADEPAPSGTVAEVIQVPNYTYLRLTTAHGEEWAAVTTTHSVNVGQQARMSRGTRMMDFTSKTLSRTFASIWFGELATN